MLCEQFGESYAREFFMNNNLPIPTGRRGRSSRKPTVEDLVAGNFKLLKSTQGQFMRTLIENYGVPAELIAQFTAKTETRQRKVGGTSVEPEPEPDTESYDEPEEGEDYDEEEEVESDVMSGVF
jgi:hypothetical protein